MDPITMMVAGIGMQFFNNYTNNKKNNEIQEKQREFRKAAEEHDFERMRKLQAESAKLALELEAEVHKERVEDINSNYDALLENFAQYFTIQNWPLNVLPFIMKGESFGSLFNGTTQSVNMHCVFTPSNCDWFNEMFYDDIDFRLETEMNNNWNAQSTHPIVYYGGGWNRRSLKHGVSQPNLIDLDDIGLLETPLKKLPVLVITPYFDPWLHFRVKLWGMGEDSELPYRIDIPHGNIENSKRIFSYDYNKEMKEEMTNDFSNTTIEEFVPYLESLVGFVADKYFWGMYGIAPKLPKELCRQGYATNLRNNFSNRYKLLFKDAARHNDIPTSKESLLSLYTGIKEFFEAEEQKIFLSDFLVTIAKNYGISNFEDGYNLEKVLSANDKGFLEKLLINVPEGNLHNIIEEIIKRMANQIPCIFTELEEVTFLDILDCSKEIIDFAVDKYLKINITDDTIIIGVLDNDKKHIISDNENPKCFIISYKNILIADRMQLKSNSITLEIDKIDKLYSQIKELY